MKNSCDYYQLLGVSRFASQETIKRAFNSQIIDVHPDHNPGNALASEETRVLVEAYKVLRDPKARHKYDLSISIALLPEILPEAPIANRCISPNVTRMSAIVFALLLIVSISLFFVHASVRDRELVIRPLFPDVKYPIVSRNFPLVIEPDIQNSLEWYHTRQYQLSLAHGWAAHEMENVYSSAAEKAMKRGDIAEAEFYRSVIINSRNNTSIVIM